MPCICPKYLRLWPYVKSDLSQNKVSSVGPTPVWPVSLWKEGIWTRHVYKEDDMKIRGEVGHPYAKVTGLREIHPPENFSQNC